MSLRHFQLSIHALPAVGPRSARSLIAVLLCIAHFLSVVAVNQALAAPPLKRIGVMLPLSGPAASVGESIRNTISLADEKLDSTGSVEFLFEDDQLQAKLAVTIAERFINQEKVDALISFSGATSAAVSEVAERRKVPLVAVTALANLGKSKNYVYSIFLGLNEQIDLLSDTVTQAGFRRVAVVTSSQEALLLLRKSFVEKNPSVIVADEEVNPGDTSLHTVVTRVQAQKPEAVLNLTLPPQTSILSRLLREQGFSGQMLGGPPLFNPPEIAAAKGALIGAKFPGANSSHAPDFESTYRKRFKTPCISEGIYGHDAAALLIQAAHSEDLLGFLRGATNFMGLAGKYRRTESNAYEVPAELKQIAADGSVVRAASLSDARPSR